MCIGAGGPHLSCDADRFHQFFRRRPRTQRRLGMALDAVGALRHVSNCDRDDLLDFCWEHTIRKDSPAEGFKGRLHAFGEFDLEPAWIEFGFWEDAVGRSLGENS